MKKIILYLLLSSSIFANSNLEWQDDKASFVLTFDDAVSYCQDLTLDGNSDWRLPNLSELTELSQRMSYKESAKSYYFWSSTVNKSFNISAWFVSLSDDYQHFSIKTKKLHVICVRGSAKKMLYPTCKNSTLKKEVNL
ncbi:MAG: DUF1566 domain-containing protein [Sulfurimonas sp.]|nr:DUF1566 domain-containing protein [Sulfurimonas sp.]MCK4975129.1 DUF1566 domain-containing protein [Sulfurimonas sp.]